MSDDLLDPALVREASRWLARLGRDDVDDTDRAACDAWRRADPRHELEFPSCFCCSGSCCQTASWPCLRVSFKWADLAKWTQKHF